VADAVVLLLGAGGLVAADGPVQVVVNGAGGDEPALAVARGLRQLVQEEAGSLLAQEREVALAVQQQLVGLLVNLGRVGVLACGKVGLRPVYGQKGGGVRGRVGARLAFREDVVGKRGELAHLLGTGPQAIDWLHSHDVPPTWS
jgi:hypothetical protein